MILIYFNDTQKRPYLYFMYFGVYNKNLKYDFGGHI